MGRSKKILIVCLIAMISGSLLFPGCEDQWIAVNQNPDGVYGVVKDYTGLDGCGFIIELYDGKKLEPVSSSDSGFVFHDQQLVYLKYSVLSGLSSICMVGEVVHIEFIREVDCTPLIMLPPKYLPDDLASDRFSIDTALIRGDCLFIAVGYSGGCREHLFRLYLEPSWCGTPPVAPPVLLLSHQANGDMCEAYLTDTLTFDLKALQVTDSSGVYFYLRPFTEQSSYYELFYYSYTKAH